MPDQGVAEVQGLTDQTGFGLGEHLSGLRWNGDRIPAGSVSWVTVSYFANDTLVVVSFFGVFAWSWHGLNHSSVIIMKMDPEYPGTVTSQIISNGSFTQEIRTPGSELGLASMCS